MSTAHILLLALLATGITGCGKGPDESPDSANETTESQERTASAVPEVSITDKKTVVRTDGGEVELAVGEEVSLPEDFPDDVFVYVPSKPLMSGQSAQGRTLMLITQDDSRDVVAAYRKEMDDRGWESQMSMNMGIQTMLVFQKGDRLATIVVSPSDKAEGTQIMITLGAS